MLQMTLPLAELERRDNAAARVARQTGVAAAQAANLADYCENLTRDYIAQGMSAAAATRRAADETMTVARSLGMFA